MNVLMIKTFCMRSVEISLRTLSVRVTSISLDNIFLGFCLRVDYSIQKEAYYVGRNISTRGVLTRLGR